ncbi:type VI secretion system baseplate subunit TssG [Nitrincola sp. MINF-07-Sa-05]|uniref:type VI secretion system baseplate subunit TssG n=1 Tax=Nitrincola salilacus TaxID=3400273 RepID=UPI0039180945
MFDLNVYLRYRPVEYDFYQLVRLAESLYVATQKRQTGLMPSDHPLEHQFISFIQQSDLSFSPQGVIAISNDADMPGKNRLRVAMFGLFGSQGVLPPFYTELLHQRARQGDHAFRVYLDALNSRTLAFLFTAWHRNRYPFIHERRQRLEEKSAFRGENLVSGFAGTHLEAFQQAPVLTQVASYFCGYFSNQRKNSAGLKAILSKVMGVEVIIGQFYARRYKLPEDECNRLGSRASSLGSDFVAGNEIIDGNMSLLITTRPVNYTLFDALQPGGPTYQLVGDVIEQYLGIGFDVDVQPVLRSSEVPVATLSQGTLIKATRLGYNSWLDGRKPGMDADDVCFTLTGHGQTG